MSTHPVTLFTGQWADLPFEEVAPALAAEWGYDGLEVAASGDHLDLRRADEDDAYVASRREILDRHGLKIFAISNHLAGQAVCDAPIDFRHQAILREYVWGDGEAEGVRQRAAEDMKRAARVARKLDIDTVVGFTGSSIWPYLAMFRRFRHPSSRVGSRTSRPVESDPRRVRCGGGAVSRTRCTRERSPTTTGRRCARWRRSTTARRSGSTGTRRT